MPRFSDYLNAVQQHMDLGPGRVLLRAWTRDEIDAVETAIRVAVVDSGIIGSPIPNFDGTNQAKGNKAEKHFLEVVRPHITAPYGIDSTREKGYPDLVFKMGEDGHCLEMKATGNWNNMDTNRRVLTSSPRKMRKLVAEGQLSEPPVHLLCTILYHRSDSTVDGVRLDFLQPDSETNIRLEASTSQYLLHQGQHHTTVIS